MKTFCWWVFCLGVLTACQDGNGDDKKQAGPVACTKEAMGVCVKTSPGEYKLDVVGRQGPQCEFEVLANQVELGLCESCLVKTPDLEAEVDAAIVAAMVCAEDADCQRFTSSASTCKAACGLIVGRDADLDHLNDLLLEWSTCDACVVDCAPPSTKALKCAQNRCQEEALPAAL